MLRRICFGLLLVVGIVGFGRQAQARDEVSLRLAVGSGPGINEAENDDPFLGTFTVPLDEDRGGQVAISVANRINVDQPIGMVFVGGLFFREHKGKDLSVFVGEEYRLNAYGIAVSPGFFVNLSNYAHLEFKIEGGIGGAHQELTGFSDSSGPYFSFGGNVGLYTHVADTILLGVEGGFQRFRSFGTLDYVDIDFRGDGETGMLVLGLVF